MLKKFSFELSRLQLMLATALWISLLPNAGTLLAFAKSPSSGAGLGAAFFVFGGWLFVLLLVFSLVASLGALFWGRSLKIICMLLLIVASVLSYFSLTLGVQFDRVMLVNILQTHASESFELVGLRVAAWVLVVGVLPAWLVWRARLAPSATWLRTVLHPLAVALLLVTLCGAVVYAQYSRYASATRNRDVSFHTLAPVNLIAASVFHTYMLRDATTVRAPRGQDARQAYTLPKPRLVVLMLGETARAQNQGLNGYERDTTPRMRAAGGLYFADTQSCGTSTAISLPCIFSGMGRSEFSLTAARSSDSLIDVMLHSGARVLWLDNDAGCKGVCDRAEVADFTGNSTGRWCPEAGECFDEILLDGLAGKLRAGTRDTLLVLHLKGSHGPAYYKRYPAEFERFTPTCKSNDLSACDVQSIRNAYDNTILYTDHMVGEVITLLQSLNDQFASALLYVSDHGESLGENGLFLHGLPYAMAPLTQTRVPMYAWISPQFTTLEQLDTACLAAQTKTARSHDNVYPTLLGLMKVATTEYKPALDLFAQCDRNTNVAREASSQEPKKP